MVVRRYWMRPYSVEAVQVFRADPETIAAARTLGARVRVEPGAMVRPGWIGLVFVETPGVWTELRDGDWIARGPGGILRITPATLARDYFSGEEVENARVAMAAPRPRGPGKG